MTDDEPKKNLKSIEVPPPHNECPGYDTKQFDGEVPVMLELWGMRRTPLQRSSTCILHLWPTGQSNLVNTSTVGPESTWCSGRLGAITRTP